MSTICCVYIKNRLIVRMGGCQFLWLGVILAMSVKHLNHLVIFGTVFLPVSEKYFTRTTDSGTFLTGQYGVSWIECIHFSLPLVEVHYDSIADG